jgi:hypothetical protein
MTDVSASVAIGISEAADAFSAFTMSDYKPVRWLRSYKVLVRKRDEVVIKCHFWLLGDPTSPYHVLVTLHPMFSTWTPIVALIVDEKTDKKTNWVFNDNKWNIKK